MTDRDGRGRDDTTGGRRKFRDAALLLPLTGALLLLPPLLGLFARPVRPFGVPLLLVYIFVVWALLIAACYWLTKRLSDGDG